MALLIGAFAAFAWLALLLLPSRPWMTRERLEPEKGDLPDLSNVTVIIPARNEAAHIGSTLSGLAAQGRNLAVIVVDDQSSDATAAVVAAAVEAHSGTLRIDLLRGAALPPGWGGKLWALDQGLREATRDWVWLLDADIELAPGVAAALLKEAAQGPRAMVSVMAELRCLSFWERLLVPPFIYFFKVIYPFARVNDPSSPVAAAAGGCILVRRDALRSIGAFESFRDALIDDCTLARLVKRSGASIWLGLSRSVVSQRRYVSLSSFAAMVSRTAFTQLRYSLALLLAVTALMLLVFGGPFLVLWLHPDAYGVALAALAFAAMLTGYRPVHRWFGLSPVWLLTFPIAAALYLGMTWLSALMWWRGIRAEWKGRSYAAR